MQKYKYFCIRCKIEITTDKWGYVECPQCKSGRYIRDYGDYEEPDWKGAPFNWNKK